MLRVLQRLGVLLQVTQAVSVIFTGSVVVSRRPETRKATTVGPVAVEQALTRSLAVPVDRERLGKGLPVEQVERICRPVAAAVALLLWALFS